MKSELKGKVTQNKQNVENTEKTEGKKRLLEAYEIYNSLVESKVADYEEVRTYLAQILEQLLQQGKIGDGVLLLSRIKSPTSVVEKWKIGQGLHDIFGVTLLTQTQEEMDEIRAAIRKEKKYDISSRKQKNEKRGYEAIHFVFNVGQEGQPKTKVECHMQTHENYKNVYPHTFYKVRRKANRDLTQEEENQIAKQIQSMYESGELQGDQLSNGQKSRVPKMWLSSFNQQGKMEEQELEEDMILTIMYPFLDISNKRHVASSSQNAMIEEPDADEVEI